MNIIVCIKRVPDSESRIGVGSDGVSVDTGGVKFVVNPYDEYAIEEALRLKEAAGDGTVTVMTLGGEESKETSVLSARETRKKRHQPHLSTYRVKKG